MIKRVLALLISVAVVVALVPSYAGANISSDNTLEISQDILNSPEEADANKAVALALSSDDFKSLRHSIQEDGLHFDAGHHQAFLVSEYENYRSYIVYFGFEPSVTGSRVGIIALVDVSTEILLIARVDQSSPDPQGLRTVTVRTAAGDQEEFTITWDIEPHNFDWDCFLGCTFVPPPVECLGGSSPAV